MAPALGAEDVYKRQEEYRRFLDPAAPFGLPDGVDPTLWAQVCRTTLERLDGRHTDSGDLPALLLMQKTLLGLRERLDIDVYKRQGSCRPPRS